MLRTPLCDLLGIDHPIVQGPFGPWSDPGLTAAISNAGALGSYGTAMHSPAQLRAALERLRDLTDRPFAVNHTLRPLSEEAFALSLEYRPAVVSLALGHARPLVERAQDAGARFVQQVTTVRQAVEAAESGVDAIIAQGAEAGGFGGAISTLALVPQVVDAVAPIPVLAAGGIADGRGLAAALVLGAQGVNIGTRFLACTEAGVPADWQRRIVESVSEDAVRVEFADAVFPPPGPGGYATAPRVLRTPFVDEWNARPQDVPAAAERLRAELMTALGEGRAHELVPFTGQTVGLIDDVAPAAEIVATLVREAEETLRRAPDFGHA
jgi:enoyl-[acyl-carrier protein] reductase II